MNKKDLIGTVIKFVITVLTAVLTTFGLASCNNIELHPSF